MTLTEALKTKLFKDKIPKSYSDNDLVPTYIDKMYKKDHDSLNPNLGFFDDGSDLKATWSSNSYKTGIIYQQADMIDEYRKLSNQPEGRMAIDEIINEAIFSPGNTDILKIEVDDSRLTENTCNVIINTFNEIQNVFDVEMNVGYLFEKWYVDGQLVINVVYDNNDLSKGIVGFNILEPKFLMYIKEKRIWKYAREVATGYSNRKELKFDGETREFSEEEIIFISSELFEQAIADVNNEGLNVIKSQLHTALKVHNQLSTLEDMLIPMRFSRSVSRRIFNVDVGDLPPSKAEAALNKIKDKFKYKKFYNVDKGTISNQMHIASLVEDYWFQNREGSKGTQVETLDESGNLGELGDIVYFRKKLFAALKIPISRVLDENNEMQNDLDYSSTQVSREEIKFFSYIQKLRKQFLRLFREALKRQLLYKGLIADEKEWNAIKPYIKIMFYKENVFLEGMETELLGKKLDLYGSITDLIGKEFSKGWVRRNVLKLSDTEIEEMKAEIAKEKTEGEYDEV